MPLILPFLELGQQGADLDSKPSPNIQVLACGAYGRASARHLARLQRLSDNDADYVDPLGMLAELREDNRAMLASMRGAHDLCDEENDVATTSLLENWIDETERRIWFLFETGRTR